LFVIGGLLLFGIGMFVIGDRHQAFARHTEYNSEFVNIAGLANGAKVRVGGMDAGQVLAITVPDSPSSRFRVKWRIDAKLRGLVRTDSVVTIGTEGIVGGTYLSVRPGSARAIQADAPTTIPSKEPTELAELLTRGNGLLGDADGMLKQIGGRLGVALDGGRDHRIERQRRCREPKARPWAAISLICSWRVALCRGIRRARCRISITPCRKCY
jgi:phospholipid/cholesterol/gamma-HCH transport system substrate-binding protein